MSLRAERSGLWAAPLALAAGVLCFLGAKRLAAPHVAAPPHVAASAEPAPSPAEPEPEPEPSAAPSADPAPEDPAPGTLESERARLLDVLTREQGLGEEGRRVVEDLLRRSPDLGQGNPEISVHPMSRAECRRVRAVERFVEGDASCGHPFMVRLRAGGQPTTVCIDQYEFPGVPCELPVVHVRASEAAALCGALGKRLCDSHEWEGACTGELAPPEAAYDFSRNRGDSNFFHNNKRARVWAYGPAKDHARCATASFITPRCPGGGYGVCGSNTYPVGAFAGCVSPIGVYDQHGNVAEHMSLPLRPAELGGRGQTEMKGSWFAFGRTEAHADDCNYRAPDWHPSTLDAPTSHKNYHLGFRCCAEAPTPR
ncbi:MAG: SUMF1/EgtB/PvdO family nonheme iron enzyme [Polyangiaceae bacterium]|nr:SUMF1/EgtB/PvdO family nonheme iron enzyme [Polyangiaceae bacterium]